ncbi:hypothetical protein P7K49_028441 [Saguinus oedipus]|uniref:Basic proline-rich protein-like n=1 Tax=Saguinus oedipus TaxID=9490 RepID=A0ABQ9UDM5_SAGOE|nr:hypothetical protein P7K49_028441 [Saguinus oedipus]
MLEKAKPEEIRTRKFRRAPSGRGLLLREDRPVGGRPASPTRPSPRPGIMQLSPSPPAFWRSAPSPRPTAQRHRPARGPPSSASNKARAKRPAAASNWGQEDGVTEEYGPANKERVPAPRPRPGRHRARCRRRPKDNAPPGPELAALTCAPGQAAAPLDRPQPAPPHGPARPTLAPRGPYLLAADAAVHRPAVSAKAPPGPRFLAANATRSRAPRQSNSNSRVAPARWSGEEELVKRDRAGAQDFRCAPGMGPEGARLLPEGRQPEKGFVFAQ